MVDLHPPVSSYADEHMSVPQPHCRLMNLEDCKPSSMDVVDRVLEILRRDVNEPRSIAVLGLEDHPTCCDELPLGLSSSGSNGSLVICDPLCTLISPSCDGRR